MESIGAIGDYTVVIGVYGGSAGAEIREILERTNRCGQMYPFGRGARTPARLAAVWCLVREVVGVIQWFVILGQPRWRQRARECDAARHSDLIGSVVAPLDRLRSAGTVAGVRHLPIERIPPRLGPVSPSGANRSQMQSDC